MKRHVQLFESWHREESIVLTSRQGRSINILAKHGTIQEIENESGVPFPFHSGQPITVFMKQWACNHGFKWNGESPCQDPGEKKVFGVKAKHIPPGHEWRRIWPGKFRD